MALFSALQSAMDDNKWGSLNADQFATLIADCEKIKADLDKLDQNVARLYAARCKRTEEDGGNWATHLAALAQSVFAVMNAGMQQYSEYMQACTDIEVAKTEKKYDREIELAEGNTYLAEGNTYKVKKAEKDKEKAIAK